MKTAAMALGALAVSATAAAAGGIDRSGQNIGIIFEKGRYVELSFGKVEPSVSGNDVAAFGGGASGSVADSFWQISRGSKIDVNENLSAALLFDNPFGADVLYAPTSLAFGGTTAVAKSTAMTALLRYKMDDNFSVHGGLKIQRSKANVTLRGLAYGALDGYNVTLDSDTGTGYVVGMAYEKPEIALRVAVTYSSGVRHDFDSVENGLPGPLAALNGVTQTTQVRTPQSVNVDFQSGVAKDTLVFGQIRWVDWSAFKLPPTGFVTASGGGLIDLEDTTTYTLGVGRKFNETWSGAASVTYEDAGDRLVSPLSPTTGKLGLTLAAIYTRNNMKITTGINYTKLGNATPETGTPDTARADFSGNKALGVGVKVGFTF